MPHNGGEEFPAEPPAAADPSAADVYRSLSSLLREIAEVKFRIPPADAEALVNDIFMSFLLRARSIREPKQWLIGAVCHASRGYWRAQRRTEPLPPDIDEYAAPGWEQLEERLVRNITLSVALSRLGPKCRDTLRMYYVDGYSAAEIGLHLGTSAGYVMQLLHTCRKRVRELCSGIGRQGDR